jgi:hypothetical protein
LAQGLDDSSFNTVRSSWSLVEIVFRIRHFV